MTIDPTQQAMRHALLRELMKRALTTMERADWKRCEGGKPRSEGGGPAADESHAGPDGRNGASPAA